MSEMVDVFHGLKRYIDILGIFYKCRTKFSVPSCMVIRSKKHF